MGHDPSPGAWRHDTGRLGLCADCGREVSRRARICVHCGRPAPASLPGRRFMALWLGLAFGVAVALSMLLFNQAASRSKAPVRTELIQHTEPASPK